MSSNGPSSANNRAQPPPQQQSNQNNNQKESSADKENKPRQPKVSASDSYVTSQFEIASIYKKAFLSSKKD